MVDYHVVVSGIAVGFETPALSSRESEEFSISLCLRLREHPPPPFYANCPMFVFVPSSPVRSFYIGHPMYRYSRCTCHTILLWMDPRFREHQLCLMFSRRSLLSVNPKPPVKATQSTSSHKGESILVSSLSFVLHDVCDVFSNSCGCCCSM